MKRIAIIGKLIHIMDAQMPVPAMWGWFHILFVILTVVACAVLCKTHGEKNEAFVRQLLLVSGLIVLLLEVYKQLNHTFRYDGVQITVDYPWYIFPFQFCSTPMYISILAAVTKSRRLREAFYAYLASYAVFAGLCVMVYPGDVFIQTIGVNVQTMVCHGAMIVVGIYLLKTGYIEPAFQTLLRAFPVFVSCVAVAAVLNELAFLGGCSPTKHLICSSSAHTVNQPYPCTPSCIRLCRIHGAFFAILSVFLLRHIWFCLQPRCSRA